VSQRIECNLPRSKQMSKQREIRKRSGSRSQLPGRFGRHGRARPSSAMAAATRGFVRFRAARAGRQTPRTFVWSRIRVPRLIRARNRELARGGLQDGRPPRAWSAPVGNTERRVQRKSGVGGGTMCTSPHALCLDRGPKVQVEIRSSHGGQKAAMAAERPPWRPQSRHGGLSAIPWVHS
jgi:hypothetical protein